MNNKRRIAWPLAWAAEWVAMLLLNALCLFAPLWTRSYSLVQGICLYGILPVAGLACAYASVRRGVNGLLALAAPPGALIVAYAAFVGTLPTGGSCAASFFAALLGSAAGVEKNRRGK